MWRLGEGGRGLRCFQAEAELYPPGIDDLQRQIGKVLDISGCESGAVSEHDAGDHRVSQITRTSSLFPAGHDVSGFIGSDTIEGGNALLQFFEDHRLERIDQVGAALSKGKRLQAEANFQDSDRCGPDRSPGLPIQPAFAASARRAHSYREQSFLETCALNPLTTQLRNFGGKAAVGKQARDGSA